jgi:hypothetical protein
MSNPTTIEDLRKLLDSAGVQPGRYVIQELGEGDVEGIGFLDGSWCTYFSERGSYNNIHRYPSEAAAIDAFLVTLRPMFASKGITIP